MPFTLLGRPAPRTRWRRLGVSVSALSALLAGTACGTAAPTAKAETTVASASAASAPDNLERQLKDLETSSRKHIGAFALDTGTGRTIGYRADELFPSLSTFKAATAAAILDKARHVDPGLLQRTIHWTPQQEVPQDGALANGHGAAGMTVAQLAAAAISVSDNTAANLLLDQLGGPAGLTRYYRSLHDPVSRLDRTEPTLNDWTPGERHDTVTPAAAARDLYRVTLGTALDSQDRATLDGWLRACATGGDRIRAGLPANWTVGDKTGTADSFGAANDIAVVWPPSHAPLILVVYTYGPTGAAIDNEVLSTTATLLAHDLGATP
jgi:beta-lactamase class A